MRAGMLAALGAVVLLAASCDSPLSGQKNRSPSPKEASPRTAAMAVPPVTLDDDYSDYRYLIEGTGPGAFSDTVPYASLPGWEQAPPLPLGTWTISVTVLDTADNTVGLGTGSVELSGGSATVPITVAAAGGTGTLTLDLSWAPSDLYFGTVRTFELILEPRPSGTAVDLSSAPGLTVDWVAGSATLAGHALPSGSYLMRMGILVDGARVWGTAKSLLILPGSDTSDPASIPTGGFNAPPYAYPSVAGGAFVPGATIRLLGGGPGTTVRYTTDGGDPAAGAVYAGGSDIALADGMTLRTYAENAFGAQSGGPWYFVESADGLYVNDIDGDDGYPGTKAGPKKTLQAAVAMANGMGGAASVTIHVAGETAGTGGTYDVPAGLTIRRPMELLGGYDPLDGTWLARDTNAYPTTIKRTSISGETSSSDAPIAVLRFPETLTGTTLIEGFTIRNQVPTVDHTAAVVIAASGTVTLSNNKIRNECNNTLSIGVLIRDSKPLIIRNASLGDDLVEGGFGLESFGILVTGSTSEPTIQDIAAIQASGMNAVGSRSAGIVFRNGARGTVDNCTVTGGGAQSSDGIVSVLGSNPTIRGSTVSGGGAAGITARSAGISVIEAGAQITDNDTFPGGILGGYASQVSAGIYADSSTSALLIQNNGNIAGGESAAGGRSAGIIFESGTASAEGTVKGNTGIRGGNAGEATGIWVRDSAIPLIEMNALIEAGGGLLTATARGIHVHGSGTGKPEPTIRANTGIRGGDAATSMGIDIEQSGPGLSIEANGNILGLGMSGAGASYGIRMPNVMPGALGSILNNPNIDGGVGANSYGVSAERGLVTLGGNEIRGGSGSTSSGIYLRWVANVRLVGGNSVYGRSAGAGSSYAMYVENSSPEISGENHIYLGNSGGATPSYGIFVYGPNLTYPANPIVGDGMNITNIYGAPTGTGGKAVALSISGAYAGGVYEMVSAKARASGTGPASALYIAADARPTIRNSRFIASDSSVTGMALGAEIAGIQSPGLLIEDSELAGGSSGSVLTSGLHLTNVAQAKIRRNRIWSGKMGGSNTQQAVVISGTTTAMDGLYFVSNAIMSPQGPGYNYGVNMMSSYGGVSSPRFYNNTVVAAASGRAFYAGADGASAELRPILYNNIFYTSMAGAAYYENSASGGNPDPAVLRNNAFYQTGVGFYYRNSDGIGLNELQINDPLISLESGGSSSGNAVASSAPVFVGGALPIDHVPFFSYDWSLDAVTDIRLREAGYDLSSEPGLDAGDLLDLYGAPRTAPYSMGAAEY